MARKKKRNNLFRVLVVIILIISAYALYQQKAPKESLEKRTDISVPDEKRNLDNDLQVKKPNEEQKPISQKTDNIQKAKIPPIPVKETDNQIGELRIEGEVVAIDEKNRTIKIEQIMDDNSVQVNPLIKIGDKAVIQNNNGAIKLSVISVGAVVDIILSNKRIARSVTVIE